MTPLLSKRGDISCGHMPIVRRSRKVVVVDICGIHDRIPAKNEDWDIVSPTAEVAKDVLPSRNVQVRS